MICGYGARNPIFLAGLGPGFTRRLGGAAADFFYSGVFDFVGLIIGLYPYSELCAAVSTGRTSAVQDRDQVHERQQRIALLLE